MAFKRVLIAINDSPAGDSVIGILKTGDPAREIVETAKKWWADFVVMGSRERLSISRVLFGSVSGSVLRHAPCPVLVVRASANSKRRNPTYRAMMQAGYPRETT